MTPTAVRAARESLRMEGQALTQGQAARLFGVDERTWRGWEDQHGRRPIPTTAALLLRACLEVRGVTQWLAKQRA